METVEVVSEVLHELELADEFLEFFLGLSEFMTEHIEFAEDGSCRIACRTSAVVCAVFLRKVALDFFKLVLDELDKLPRFCLVRIEFLFRTLDLVEVHRYFFAEVDEKTVVIVCSEETRFCHSLFLQCINAFSSRYVRDVVNALVRAVDSFIEMPPF